VRETKVRKNLRAELRRQPFENAHSVGFVHGFKKLGRDRRVAFDIQPKKRKERRALFLS
jgi:hypothetical protein